MSTRQQYDKKNKNREINTWGGYIEANIASRLTTASIAAQFGYSDTQFKRLFRQHYGMSVADYIRKRRLSLIAEKIRGGMNYTVAASYYGFHTHAGISRAFSKEYFVSPAVYGQGKFETLNVDRYMEEKEGVLQMSVLQMPKIEVKTSVLVRADNVQLCKPAQLAYWKEHGFPSVPQQRTCCNIENREDKIALWYHDSDDLELKYMIGSLTDKVKDTENEECRKLILEEGLYAIFQTSEASDEKNLTETLDILIRCVVLGWIKENRDRIDSSRLIYERYANNKVYFFVPVKD